MFGNQFPPQSNNNNIEQDDHDFYLKVQVQKLYSVGLSTSLCLWIRDFLNNRSQVVRIGDNHSKAQ